MIALAVILIVVLLYILFFKPSPVVRVNLDKIQPIKGDSVLTLDAPTEVGGVGKKFKMTIELDSKGHVINSVQAHIKFDPRVLEIVSTNTENSFCKYYIENNYDNAKGEIKLACGTPYPGFRGQNSVETIEFLAKAIKTTDIIMEKESMVLANDGKGTNVLKELSNIKVNVKAGL